MIKQRFNIKKIISRTFIILLFAALSGCYEKVDTIDKKEITDEDISDAVKTEFLLNEIVPSEEIEVTVDKRTVSLTGTVSNILIKDIAEELALSVKGVIAVINRINVSPVDRTDEEIKDDITNSFLLDPVAEFYEIEAKVNNGVVTLTGQVESFAEKQLCEEIAKSINGVKSVINNIEVALAINRSEEEIKYEVEEALENDVYVRDELINVTVEDGTVYLEGSVGSAIEKKWAYENAFVAGVNKVNIEELEIDWWAQDEMMKKSKAIFKSDSAIKNAVETALENDPRVEIFDISVKVNEGVVTLSGNVDNIRAKNSAESDTENTAGVIDVKNNINVEVTEDETDVELKTSIKFLINKDPFLADNKINVEVEDGIVNLSGTVESIYESLRTVNIVSGLIGVTEIVNNLDTKYEDPSNTDEEIQLEIQNQIFWNPYVNGSKIEATVIDGTATLTGKVHNRFEMKQAVKEAKQAGADKVLNNLIIQAGAPTIDD